MAETYDMAVVGGGPGGYVCALRGRQLGLAVVLIEKERVGGLCLNRGCIPTKALLSDAERIRWTRKAASVGILDQAPTFSFAGIMKRKDDVVRKMTSNLEGLLSSTGITLINEPARVPEPGTLVTVSGKIIKASNIVIATGSRPWVPPIPGTDLPGVKGTREALDMEKVPEKMVVVGGGVIGQEFAAIFSGLGTEVTILETLGRVLNDVDEEIVKRYSALLPSLGITTEVHVRINRIEKSGDHLKVFYQWRDKEKVASADMVLIAAGRRPNIDGSGIVELGVRTINGAVQVDEFLQTSLAGIYAVGDVVGRKMLAHVASYHGEIVAENIAGHEKPCQDDIVPACVFTTPQIAWAGLTEDQVKKSGRPFRTSSFSLSASGKALAVGESHGLLKLIEDTGTGKLIGAHFLGPNVSELVGEAALAMKKGLSASDLAETIHPHPTVSEAMREAVLGFLGGPLHAVSRTKVFAG
ncbi:MAG: dihydrolipoyl dehydrogenase [Desulfomonile sp.]|jgi:dihydrolipoamide dehydrogenase